MRAILLIVFFCLLPGTVLAQTWTVVGAMNRARAGHTAAAHGTDLYVFGGWGVTQNPGSSVERLDTITSTWTELPGLMPVPHLIAASVTVGDEIHIIAGGTDLVSTFNAVDHTWSSAAPLPVSLYGAQAVYLDDRIWVLGGNLDYASPSTAVSSVYRSNDLSVSGGAITGWTAYSQDLPTPLSNHQAVVSGGVIYVTGGTQDPDLPASPVPQILSLDPDVGTWVAEGSLPIATTEHASAAVGARVFSFGGKGPGGSAPNQNAVFAALTGAVTSGTNYYACYGHQATAIGDLVYVTGGYAEGSPAAESFCRVYDPTSDGYPVRYAVGGTISGLVGTMTLQLNGANDMLVTGDGPYQFPALAVAGESYAVTVLDSPSGLDCTVQNGTGSMAYAAVTNVDIVCEASPPIITSVLDVPGDQGGRVRLRWDANIFDSGFAVTPVTEYAVFRRIDVGTGSEEKKSYPHGDWDFVTTVPAFQETNYSAVVPEGMHWSVFFVRAATGDAGLFFDSVPDSGWSVDNLAPSAPSGMLLAAGQLAWDECTADDFDYFTVYGSASGDLPGASLLGHTTGTVFDVAGAGHDWLLVTATDFAGNEGPPASLQDVSGIPGAGTGRYALHDSYPNPFNPQTTIVFEIPTAQVVTLQVFDLSGRLIRRLVGSENRTPGRHEVVWDGRDDDGREASSGVYLYRLEAGPYDETKRMIMVK
jgi:hypothetical protein